MRTAWNTLTVLCIVVGASLGVSTAGAGPKLEVGEDAWFQPAFLGQVHYSFRNGVADEDDFYLRRGRIILKGQIMDGVKFFVETDNDNAGRSGVSASTDIQDAFVDVRLFETEAYSLWADAGLILLPFSLENRSSAASLLGLDYNAESIRFANHFVWRDYGAELRGKCTKWVTFRAGVFDGYDEPDTAKHPGAELRYCGQVAVNVIGDVEQAGWFCSQNRLGQSQYLVIGAGYNQQDRATLGTVVAGGTTNRVVRDSDAWVVDFQSSVNLVGPVSLLLNGAYYGWDNATFDGNTGFIEGGVYCRDTKAMVTGKYSLADPDADGVGKTEDYTVGVHYFLKGQNLRGGIEYRWGDNDDWFLAGVQFLL